ncbi:unnamed protein product [Echinostoma caproni]|uniref:DUF5743 domain-containing protein n=1 Tax=Echinostoma caproni TaxID=27848 RepID=A0A183A7W9_9TREM|nr:unnamed protein product [Echinostoma caproni]
MKVCQLTDRIEALEQEVEKYRILAGIENLTRSSLLDESNHAHRSETGPCSPPSHPGFERRFMKRFTTSSPVRGDRPRPMRVGFSFPEAVDADSNPHKPPQRPRARSEVTDAADAMRSAIDSPPPPPPPPASNAPEVVDRTGVISPTTSSPGSHLSDFVTDELPRTKGFLRRLKQMSAATAANTATGGSGSSTGTDSGLGNSRTSRTDSRDTSTRSEFSMDTEDGDRSQYRQTSTTDRTPQVPQRNADLFPRSLERSDRTPMTTALPPHLDNTERADPYHSTEVEPAPSASNSAQATDVLGRALHAMHRTNYPTGFTANEAGSHGPRLRVSICIVV